MRDLAQLIQQRHDEARERYDRYSESDLPSARAFGAWQALSDLLAELPTATQDLTALLREAINAMHEVNNNTENDWFGESCPVCDGAIPLRHSLLCRLETAARRLATRGD